MGIPLPYHGPHGSHSSWVQTQAASLLGHTLLRPLDIRAGRNLTGLILRVVAMRRGPADLQLQECNWLMAQLPCSEIQG